MFSKDLCNTLQLANIPLKNLKNRYVHLFFKKYTGKDIPLVSLLRKTYVDEYYKDTMNEIKYIIEKRFGCSSTKPNLSDNKLQML